MRAKILLALLAGILPLILCEVGAAIYTKLALPVRSSTPDRSMYSVDRSNLLGYELKANGKFTAQKSLNDGSLCYRAEYTTDERRRRVVGHAPKPGRRHLILFGNSFAFGEGLNSEDTLQWQLGQENRDHNVFNYAVHGYGPEHMLALLQSRNIADEVFEHDGELIYLLIPQDIFRTMGASNALWVFDGPYYTLVDGRLKHLGSFRSGRELTSAWYEIAAWLRSHSYFLSLIDFHVPLIISDDHINLMVEIFKAARDEYQRHLNGKFLVVLHPVWAEATNTRLYRNLSAGLARAKVDVLDLSALGYAAADMIKPGCDEHPNALANSKLSAEISKWLRTSGIMTGVAPQEAAETQAISGKK